MNNKKLNINNNKIKDTSSFNLMYEITIDFRLFTNIKDKS